MNYAKSLFFFATFLMATLTFSLPLEIHAADKSVDPMQSLSIYPADIRDATAIVLQHPEVLLELEKYRQVARGHFKQLLASYPQQTQETVRQLVPYRKLWRGLGAYMGKEKETQEFLKTYSKDIQNLANDLLKNSPDIIGKVVSMEKETYQHFFKMISGLDAPTQDAFKKVGQQSGIFSVLSNALNLSSAGNEPSPELKQKSQNLANQLLALNRDRKPEGSAPSASSSEASATLHAERKKLNKGLDSQIDQDPYSENAIQANVTFGHDPYPINIGASYQPYWY